mmetsp:Transcript_17376/g.52229  ORF Transcript_17376/g.52229 Transcript_17376/m.52229 type:complete len:171 (-) Transcript_17376:74-586(-)
MGSGELRCIVWWVAAACLLAITSCLEAVHMDVGAAPNICCDPGGEPPGSPSLTAVTMDAWLVPLVDGVPSTRREREKGLALVGPAPDVSTAESSWFGPPCAAGVCTALSGAVAWPLANDRRVSGGGEATKLQVLPRQRSLPAAWTAFVSKGSSTHAAAKQALSTMTGSVT